MDRLQKQELKKRFEDLISSQELLLVGGFKGLSGSEAVTLRRVVSRAGSEMLTMKNSVFRKAVKGSWAEKLLEGLEGPSFLIWGGEAIALSKALKAFQDETEDRAKFNLLMMDPNNPSLATVEAFAKIPSLEVLYGQLLNVLNGPMSKLVRTLNEIPAAVAGNV